MSNVKNFFKMFSMLLNSRTNISKPKATVSFSRFRPDIFNVDWRKIHKNNGRGLMALGGIFSAAIAVIVVCLILK